MIVLMTDPSEKDLEIVRRILGDSTLKPFIIEPGGLEPTATVPVDQWMSFEVFRDQMEMRGWNCKHPITRKKLALRFGFQQRMKGRSYEFQGDFSKVKNRKKN
jgi:hypothetical protein